MQDQKEKIAAVVVTYNRKELLVKGLDSLLGQTQPLDSILIIDNASNDGTFEYLNTKGYLSNPKVDYAKMPQNTGGSGGFYEGVKRAYEAGFDWIWLMDDDVVPDKECLEKLLKYKNISKTLVPVRVFADYDIDPITAININLDHLFPLGLRKSLLSEKYKTIDQLPDTIDIQDITFEGPLFHRDIIKSIGLPNKKFFIFCDDTEYAIKIIRELKTKIVMVKKARMNRLLPLKKSEKIGWREYYCWRNIFYLYRRYGKDQLIKNKPIILFIGIIAKKIFKRQFNFSVLKILLNSIHDAYRGQFPQKYRS